ncbi:MAG: PAS domain-containing protein, partial [Bacteroidota bacterium]
RRNDHLELLSLVAEHTKDNILITGPDRKIEWANQAFLDDTGYSWEEVVGRSPRELLQGPATDPATAKRMRELLHANRDVDLEIQNHRKNGQAFWCHLVINPIFNERGEVMRFISVQRDISVQKRLAEQVRQTSRRLLQTTIDSQEEERKRIANELHDGIGVLLSAASMRLSLLHDLKPDEIEQENFDHKLNNVERMFRDAVAEVRAISHNMHPPALEMLGLGTALEHFFRRVGESSKLRLELALDRQPLDAYKRREALLIYRVCQEVMHNVIKHAKASSFVANAFAVGEASEQRTMIILQDNGVGMNIADWQQSDGLGYGSVMSRIQLLNGSCRVRRLAGGGTRFTIELPTADR